MPIYKSENGKSYIELDKINTDRSNGSQTVEYRIDVSSYGFSASTANIWFYQEDLIDFCRKIDALASGKQENISVSAMSDFTLNISPKDRQGHFTVKAKVLNEFHGNLAEISVELETQAILNMAKYLGQIS